MLKGFIYIHINVELEQFEQLFSLPGQFGVSAHRFLDFSLDFQNRTVQFCNLKKNNLLVLLRSFNVI